MKKKALVSAFFVGAGSILAQVILIRELLVVFSGNELSIGIMLASWLTGGAFGALALSRIFKNAFKGVFLLASAVMPLAIFASRASRIIFNIPIIELVSPLQTLIISSAILFPVSALFSLTFIFSCGMTGHERGGENIAGRTYILEALGAAFAGILFTFILAKHFTAFQLVFWLLAINAAWVAFAFQKNKIFYVTAFCAAAAILAAGNFNAIDKTSQRLEWKGRKVLEYTSSRYGNITVTESSGVVSVYENGTLVFTTEDQTFDEELAHLIMLEHPSPGKVLLIGGGSGSFLRQVLMHDVSKIVYLELDPVLIGISKKYSLPEDRAAFTDKRVKIENQDGVFYLKNTREKFDVIIVNLPDPTTLQINRFYTKEFYNTAKSALKKDGGIFATYVSSDENIISYETARYNASILKTLKSAFGYTSFIPGERLIFLASPYSVFNDLSPETLSDRFRKRRLSTRFFTEYHIQDRLYPDTVSYVKKSIDAAYLSADTNTDFRPIAFYYDITLWGIRFYPKARDVFIKIMKFVNMRNIALLAFLFFLPAFMLAKKVKNPTSFALFLAIAGIGFAGIIAHLSFIIGFQALYGYVYAEIGMITALFMFGLAAGARTAQNLQKNIKNPLRAFRLLVIAFASYMLLLPAFMAFFQATSGKAVKPLFYFLIFFNGFLMGTQFSLGLGVLIRGNGRPSHALSFLWGADLIGATLGTLMASIVLIPLLGIFQSILTGFLFVLASVFLLFSRRRL